MTQHHHFSFFVYLIPASRFSSFLLSFFVLGFQCDFNHTSSIPLKSILFVFFYFFFLLVTFFNIPLVLSDSTVRGFLGRKTRFFNGDPTLIRDFFFTGTLSFIELLLLMVPQLSKKTLMVH